MITVYHDKILQTIPFALICETHDGARWKTGKRKRAWDETFSPQEQAACERLFVKARDWIFVHGVPDLVRMKRSTYDLWLRLGEFCASL